MNTSIKKFLAAPLLMLASAFAQEQTLLGDSGPLTHGGFGAPVVKMTTVDGHSRVLMGVEGAWIVNHGFYLGLGGYGMAKGIETNLRDSLGDTQYLHMGYGGVLTGYTLHSDRILHLGIQQLLGGGGAELSSEQWGDRHDEDYDDEERCDRNVATFFVWEPQLNAELNVARYARLAIGAGYRYTWMPDEKFGYSDNDLGGFAGSVALKFGRF